MRPYILREQLQAVADLVPKPEPTPKRRFDQTKPSHNGHHRHLLVDQYLQDAGVEFKAEPTNGGQKFVLNACPFDPGHTGKDAAIFQSLDGMTTFHCFHDSCQGRTWADVKRKLGEPANYHYDPPKHEAPQPNHQEPDEEPFNLKPVNIAQLVAEYPKLRTPIIDGLLREGETLGIHAKSKAGKSWGGYGLALSVASRSCWLGKYRCERGKVLLLDNELHAENLANRIPSVAKAMGLRLADYQAGFDVLPLRGQLRDIFRLKSLFDSITPGDYKLIMIDALYRILPPGISENDNAAMAEVMNAIDRYAFQIGSAFVFIHHATKGSQSEKAVTDVGSGAGSISRAVDTHLVMRPHEEPEHIVMDAAVRSFAPVDPVVLRWEFPVWQVAHDMDPHALKGRFTAREEKQREQDREGMEQILEALQREPMTSRRLQTETSIGRNRCERLLGILMAQNKIISKEGFGQWKSLPRVQQSRGCIMRRRTPMQPPITNQGRNA